MTDANEQDPNGEKAAELPEPFRYTANNPIPESPRGKLARAGQQIPKGRKVIEYAGERISRRETRRRSEIQDKQIYLFTLDNYWTLDGASGGSGAEYVNHSCDPNLYTWIFKGHILYMSARPIKRGEELTVDYHFSKDIEEVPCFCGSAKCRGTINLK